jgi:hypothetical protein
MKKWADQIFKQVNSMPNQIWNEYENEYHEIIDYITKIFEIKNPFDQTWTASYELPFFIIDRIKKLNYYNDTEIKRLYNDVIQWCSPK